MVSKKSSDPAEPMSADASAADPAATKKGTPTPSRRDAEAARRQRLNPALSPKEAKRRQRHMQQVRQRQRADAQEATPVRSLVRDVVDSRRNLGEFLLPVLILGLAIGLVPAVQAYNGILVALVWGYMAAVIVDAWIMWRRVRRLAAERLPQESLKGALTYGLNRQLQTRRRRRPEPRVKIGDAV